MPRRRIPKYGQAIARFGGQEFAGEPEEVEKGIRRTRYQEGLRRFQGAGGVRTTAPQVRPPGGEPGGVGLPREAPVQAAAEQRRRIARIGGRLPGAERRAVEAGDIAATEAIEAEKRERVGEERFERGLRLKGEPARVRGELAGASAKEVQELKGEQDAAKTAFIEAQKAGRAEEKEQHLERMFAAGTRRAILQAELEGKVVGTPAWETAIHAELEKSVVEAGLKERSAITVAYGRAIQAVETIDIKDESLRDVARASINKFFSLKLRKLGEGLTVAPTIPKPPPPEPGSEQEMMQVLNRPELQNPQPGSEEWATRNQIVQSLLQKLVERGNQS